MFTTVTKVRQYAGFVNNTNITDAFIANQITRAENHIKSYIGDVYALPLPKFYENTIVFSGTGNGTSVMTLTVGGVAYTVTMSVGKTASQAADLFRTAAGSATNFVTDGLGSGATVTIHNNDQTEDSTDVTITSTDPQTVSGITATGGTVSEVAIPMLDGLAVEIATAYLFIAEYGAETQNNDKDGFKRLASADEFLKRIQDKKDKLLDFSDTELAGSTTQRLRFFPTTGSVDDNGEDVERVFTMNKKF